MITLCSYYDLGILVDEQSHQIDCSLHVLEYGLEDEKDDEWRSMIMLIYKNKLSYDQIYELYYEIVGEKD